MCFKASYGKSHEAVIYQRRNRHIEWDDPGTENKFFKLYTLERKDDCNKVFLSVNGYSVVYNLS